MRPQRSTPAPQPHSPTGPTHQPPSHCCCVDDAHAPAGCPPRPGYTAFTDASWYLRASYLDLHKASAAHAEAACNANPDCPGFTLASDGTAEYVVNGTIVNFEMNYGVCTYIKSGAWGNAACDCLDSYLMGDRLYTGCAIDYRDKPFCVVSPLSCKNPDYYMTDLKGTLPAIFCTFGPGIAIRPSAPPTPPPALPPPVYKLIRSGACGACLVAEPWEGGRLTTAPCNPASLYQQFQLEQASKLCVGFIHKMNCTQPINTVGAT